MNHVAHRNGTRAFIRTGAIYLHLHVVVRKKAVSQGPENTKLNELGAVPHQRDTHNCGQEPEVPERVAEHREEEEEVDWVPGRW